MLTLASIGEASASLLTIFAALSLLLRSGVVLMVVTLRQMLGLLLPLRPVHYCNCYVALVYAFVGCLLRGLAGHS